MKSSSSVKTWMWPPWLMRLMLAFQPNKSLAAKHGKQAMRMSGLFSGLLHWDNHPYRLVAILKRRAFRSFDVISKSCFIASLPQEVSLDADFQPLELSEPSRPIEKPSSMFELGSYSSPTFRVFL